MFKIVNSDITLDLRCGPSDYMSSASKESKFNYWKKNDNNTIFIFQFMIFITTYKILGFTPWFTNKLN